MTEQAHPDQDAQTHTAAAEYAALAGTPPTPDGEHIAPTESAPEAEEAAHELRAAQAGWLERRGLLEDTPHLTMTRRELEILSSVGLGDGGNATSRIIDESRKNYGIPPDTQYALLDIAPDDASLPHTIEVVALQEEDFGTTIDEGRLESLGVQSENIPRIAMKEREFGLFRAIGIDDGNASSIKYARELYGVPNGDQLAPEYALVDVEPDDPNLPSEPLLMTINEVDFGTTIDRRVLDKDNAYLNHDPDSPRTPGTHHTVDIGKTLTDSYYGLQAFASELMKGETTNPLSGNFWMRAGGLAEGQQDAYVWENSRPIASAVELTIAFPGQYNSVCAVVGDRQDPGNGKAGMAQIKDPEVILGIEGENLKRLQDVYRNLYHEPNFALTSEQRSRRDEVFNNYLVSFTSEATRKNKAREDDENRRRYQDSQPRYRYLDSP
jgi:hypothetical protein